MSEAGSWWSPVPGEDGLRDCIRMADERIAELDAKNERLREALGEAVKQHDELVAQMRPEFPGVPLEIWEKPGSWIHGARAALEEEA